MYNKYMNYKNFLTKIIIPWTQISLVPWLTSLALNILQINQQYKQVRLVHFNTILTEMDRMTRVSQALSALRKRKAKPL